MFRYYPLTLLAVIVTATVCLMPIPEPPLGDVPFMDKWTHMVLFGGIASVALFELAMNRGLHTSWRWTFPVLAALYGGLIEVMQAFLTSTRSGDWWDFLADVVGVAVIAPIVYAVLRRFRRGDSTSV